MSKKHDYHIKYSIMVNGEEYDREFTVKAVTSKYNAEKKLRELCKEDIIVTSNEAL